MRELRETAERITAMTEEKKALGAQELRGLEIAIRSAKFRRQEFPIPCGLPEEIYPQLMEVIRAYAASLADSPSPTAPQQVTYETSIAPIVDLANPVQQIQLAADSVLDAPQLLGEQGRIRQAGTGANRGAETKEAGMGRVGADSPSGTAAETKDDKFSRVHDFVKARVAHWREEAQKEQRPASLQEVYINQEVAYSDILGFVEELAPSSPSLREKEAEWISVEERLPREMEFVLVFRTRSLPQQRISQFFEERFHNFDKWPMPFLADVTHWMPLPAPPKTEAGK
jgi:hypothetical protein